MTFAALGLAADLCQTLAGLGYDQPTPVQKKAIPAVLGGRDVLAAAQTGTGKTAAFVLPILQRLAAADAPAGERAVRAVIVVPTRELAEQVLAAVARYSAALPLSCYAAYGGVNLGPQISRLQDGVDVLVATPGRLLDLFTKSALHFRQLQTLVLDEADRMLDLGFAEDLAALFPAMPRQRQTLLFSATFSDAVRDIARNRLRQPLTLEAAPRNTAAPAVRQWVVPVDKKRKPDLLRFMLRDRGWRQVLVFVKTKKGCDELAQYLAASGFAVDALHGDRTQAARQQALDRFKAGALDLLVATDVAARGLDIQGLPQVINVDLPLQAEDYIHRIGRTGRAGQAGEAVSLVCADEAPLLSAIETLLKKPLSRDEEPGFEPRHQLPATGPGASARAPRAKPLPAGKRPRVPGNWEGFDSPGRGRRGGGTSRSTANPGRNRGR